MQYIRKTKIVGTIGPASENKLEELLLNLNKYSIKGVLFYDIGVLNIYNRLNLNYDLVWAQEHLTTNFNTYI